MHMRRIVSGLFVNYKRADWVADYSSAMCVVRSCQDRFSTSAAATQRSAERVKIRINYRGVNYGVMAEG